MNHIKISVYINEGDKWQHRPLHLELLNMLDENGIAGGTGVTWGCWIYF
ncbi:DUF190 domain-containing protein [Legionella sainthelensi]|nr:DUF190 domain-containing protein [Legionella sainthelensi]